MNGSTMELDGHMNKSFAYLTVLNSDVDDNHTIKYVAIFMSCFMTLTMVIGLLGNGCSCAVVLLNPSMRTPINLYLFNLSFTDFLMCLLTPVELYSMWNSNYYPFGAIACQINCVAFDIVSNSSVLTITVFSIERYMVVTKPFLRKRLSSKSRVLKIIAAIWVIAFIFSVPDMLFTYYIADASLEHRVCLVEVNKWTSAALMLDAFLFFFIPAIMITVLYTLIAFRLNTSRRKSINRSGKQRRHKAVKMLAAVAGMFFVCWSPYCIFRISIVTKIFINKHLVWNIFCFLCAFNIYLSTSINPILYCLMSRRFREAFKDMILGRTAEKLKARTRNSSLLFQTARSSVKV